MVADVSTYLPICGVHVSGCRYIVRSVDVVVCGILVYRVYIVLYIYIVYCSSDLYRYYIVLYISIVWLCVRSGVWCGALVSVARGVVRSTAISLVRDISIGRHRARIL